MIGEPPWVRWLLGFFGVLLVAFVLFPIFDRARFNHHYGSCQSNLKQIGLGIMQYTQDYDEKFPGVSTDVGWVNELQPYLKSTQIFQCPTESNTPPSPADPRLTGYTDYFYNAQLEKREMGKMNDLTRLIMAADGNDGQENTDASYAKIGIPEPWRADVNSPAFRHLGWANYLFVDGHVKAVKVEGIATNWSVTKFYFQPPKAVKISK